MSKILVSTGNPTNHATNITEIINLDNEDLTCQDVEDYPFVTSYAVGSNMGSFPVICGGTDYYVSGSSVNKCHRLIAGRWQQFANMTKRYIYLSRVPRYVLG